MAKIAVKESMAVFIQGVFLIANTALSPWDTLEIESLAKSTQTETMVEFVQSIEIEETESEELGINEMWELLNDGLDAQEPYIGEQKKKNEERAQNESNQRSFF